MGQVMLHNTHGKEEVERASLTFLVGNVARSANQQAIVLLTIEGVWLAKPGYAQGVQAPGFAPLAELIQQFVASGGRIWVCGACAKPRNITQADLIEGAEIIAAATAVEAL